MREDRSPSESILPACSFACGPATLGAKLIEMCQTQQHILVRTHGKMVKRKCLPSDRIGYGDIVHRLLWELAQHTLDVACAAGGEGTLGLDEE
jgi:hypothetical protein